MKKIVLNTKRGKVTIGKLIWMQSQVQCFNKAASTEAS